MIVHWQQPKQIFVHLGAHLNNEGRNCTRGDIQKKTSRLGVFKDLMLQPIAHAMSII